MNDNSYWNAYYSERRSNKVPLPSQFAAFVAGELGDSVDTVVDLGCGNGRDSLFFARHGYSVVGVDASAAAIDWCVAEAEGLDARFIRSEIDASELVGNIKAAAGNDKRLLVYARFFLHAIDDAGERALLDLCAGLGESVHRIALEFRTIRDREQAKVTAAHYRRFVDPVEFLSRAIAHGFEPAYFVEGFGFAKYRHDDAHVARVLLKRR